MTTFTLSVKRIIRAAALGTLGLLVVFVALDQLIVRLFDPRADNVARQVVIYTTDWCPFCTQLRACLSAGQIPFIEKDVEKSMSAQAEHWALRARGVPVTLVGQEVVYGLRKPELTLLLQRAGYDFRCWNAQHHIPANVPAAEDA